MKTKFFNRIFSTFILCIIFSLPVFAENEYKVNIPKNIEIKNEVLKSAKISDIDCPINLNNETNLEILALQMKFINDSCTKLSAQEKLKINTLQKKLTDKLKKEILAYSFSTQIDDKDALHEITVALLNIPFSEFQKRFNPARDWGHYLYKYYGGEVITDLYNEKNQEILQRERMILGVPWYALGVPLLDMSKYEVIEYGNDNVIVNWKVTFSENKSVYLDIGYVRFSKYRNKTMIIFNSIHSINQGWFGNSLPGVLKTPIALKTLRDMFKAHIENYIDVLKIN